MLKQMGKKIFIILLKKCLSSPMVLVPSSATSMHTFGLGLGAGPDQNFVVLLSVFCSSNCFGAYKNKSKTNYI